MLIWHLIKTCFSGLACTNGICTCNDSSNLCENQLINCLADNSGDSCVMDQYIEDKGRCQFTCGGDVDTWNNIGNATVERLMSVTNSLNNSPSKMESLGSLLEALMVAA